MQILLLVSGIIAMISLSSAAPLCTKEQTAAFYTDELSKCSSQIYDFNVCDDACLATLLKLKTAASDCAETEGANSTLVTTAGDYVARCTKYAADTATKYVPRTTTGLPICTEEQREPWDTKYGLLSPTQDCRKMYAGKTQYCAADCLEKLEEAVLQSPVCAKKNDKDFWIGEKEKKYLQRCLLSRTSKVADNRAMRTSPTSDGKLEVAPIASSSNTTTITTTTTTAPTTNAPSTSSVSGAAAVSLLAIVGSVGMALLL